MLNDTFILVDTIEEAFSVQRIPLPARVRMTYAIDLHDRPAINHWAAFFFDNGEQQSFSICLKIMNTDIPVYLNDIAVILAHPAYHKMFDSITVLLQCDSDTAETVSLVHRFLQEQGYSSCDTRVLDSSFYRATGFLAVGYVLQKTVCLRSPEEFEAYYRHYVNKNYQYTDFFVTRYDSHTGAKALVKMLGDTSKRINEEDAYLASMINQVAEGSEALAVSTLKNAMLEKEIGIMNELFRLKSENNEMERVLGFYYKQYEVLPLWYKRVGHLIKVIMGKRTFKSLFHDSH